MIALFEEIKWEFKNVSREPLIPPRVPPPAKKQRGMIKAGYLPLELRKLCTLNEKYLAGKNTTQKRWKSRLETKQKIVLAAYEFRLRERYGAKKPLMVCSNWAVYLLDGF
jgi:hypothetical protein